MNNERFWETADYRKILPTPLHEFKQLPPEAEINIPELSENRKLTDIYYFVIFVVSISTMLGLTIYVCVTTDLNNFWHDRDHCGNFCGRKNDPADVRKDCEAKDFRNYPLAEYWKSNDTNRKLVPGICISIEECTAKNKTAMFRRCVSEISEATQIDEIVFAVSKIPIGVAVSALFSVCVMVIVYLYSRHNAKYIFTAVLIPQIIFIILIIIFLYLNIFWMSTFKIGKHLLLLLIAIAATLALIIGPVIVYLFRRYYKLIIVIYEETATFIFGNKMLLVLPIVMTILRFGLLGFVACMAAIGYSMDDDKINLRNFYVSFVLGPVVLWLFKCIYNYHVMIITGVISARYFSRNESNARGALCTSFIVMTRYHLGTIAFAAFLSPLSMIRIIVVVVRSQMVGKKNVVIRCFCKCILSSLSCLEAIAQYVGTTKACMLTAIHGKELCESGRRAARLTWCCLLDLMFVDTLVFCLMKFISYIFILMAITVAILTIWIYFSEAAHSAGQITLFITFVAAFVIINFYAALMIVSAETIYLCYCEDKLLNDGSLDRPYFMTKRLHGALNTAIEMGLKEKEKHRPPPGVQDST